VAPRFSFSVKFGDMLRMALATPRLWAPLARPPRAAAARRSHAARHRP
jgi:hypothetical protein